ncbi:hypothetical protein CBL_20300 [Carabus blaptoides fortunei]
MFKVLQESEATVHASYVLSEMMAKDSNPFTEGTFIKECIIKAAEIVCPGNVKPFQAISSSRNTVAERVTDLAANLSDEIRAKSSSFERFSIACDESTDIGDVAQLAVFLRAMAVPNRAPLNDWLDIVDGDIWHPVRSWPAGMEHMWRCSNLGYTHRVYITSFAFCNGLDPQHLVNSLWAINVMMTRQKESLKYPALDTCMANKKILPKINDNLNRDF